MTDPVTSEAWDLREEYDQRTPTPPGCSCGPWVLAMVVLVVLIGIFI